MQKLTFLSFNQLKPVWNENQLNELINLLNKKHSSYLENESFKLESGCNKEQVQIRVSLETDNGSKVYPIEIICISDEYTDIKQPKIAQLMLDYIDLYWSEYFAQDRELFVPIDWSPSEFEEITFYLRGFIRNLDLEMQADILLKKFGPGEHEISPISADL